MERPNQLTDKQRYWYNHLQRAQATGIRLADYAKQENLDLKALYNYQSVLRKKGLIEPKSKFTRLTLPMENAIPPTNTLARITLLNGISVDVPVNTDNLDQLLKTVGSI